MSNFKMNEDGIKLMSNLSKMKLKVEQHVDSLKALSSGQLAASLGKAVNQYKVLKRQFVMLQTRMLLYETLEGAQCPGIEEIENERKATMEEIRGQQTAIESSKSNIETLAEQLQSALCIYQGKRATLQRRLQEVTERKRQLEDSQTDQETSQCDSLDRLNVVLERVSHELKHLMEVEATWCRELEDLKHVHSEIQVTERAANQMCRDLEDRKTHLLQNNRHLGEETEAERLCRLHGIQNIQFLDNILRVNLDPQGDVGVELSVKFVKERGEHKIQSASVDPSGVGIDDIVKAAQESNDVVYLVSAVLTRWQQSHRLISEIEHLRHRFALDWRHSDRVVQVLYGEVVCSLQVEKNYPSPQSVHLMSISGTEKTIQSAPSETSTLTEWLEYLEKELHH